MSDERPGHACCRAPAVSACRPVLLRQMPMLLLLQCGDCTEMVA